MDPATEENIMMVLAHPSGITKLEKGTLKYNASTDLISEGVTFNKCDAGNAGTIKKLSQTSAYDRYKKEPWASSTRLDNQGDIKCGSLKFARLAIQIGNETHAQANVQIGVEFGKTPRGIRNALVRSLSTADVQWLSQNKSFNDQATSLGHSVITPEMCLTLEEEASE